MNMNEIVVNSLLGATAVITFHKINIFHRLVYVNLHNQAHHYTTTHIVEKSIFETSSVFNLESLIDLSNDNSSIQNSLRHLQSEGDFHLYSSWIRVRSISFGHLISAYLPNCSLVGAEKIRSSFSCKNNDCGKITRSLELIA